MKFNPILVHSLQIQLFITIFYNFSSSSSSSASSFFCAIVRVMCSCYTKRGTKLINFFDKTILKTFCPFYVSHSPLSLGFVGLKFLSTAPENFDAAFSIQMRICKRGKIRRSWFARKLARVIITNRHFHFVIIIYQVSGALQKSTSPVQRLLIFICDPLRAPVRSCFEYQSHEDGIGAYINTHTKRSPFYRYAIHIQAALICKFRKPKSYIFSTSN